MIYLDHNATTPIDKEVKEAMINAFDVYGNPSSSHVPGMNARAIVEESRGQTAKLIGSDKSEIVFTSCGTESNNLAIIGTAYRFQTGHIITSSIEHPSVLNPVKWLESKGFKATYLPVDSDGRVCPDDVKKAVRKDTILITIMHSNNETGVLQPIREIGAIAREFDVAFHSDAAQSVGKMDVNVAELMVDMLTIVPHKFYGPKGIGALYLKDGINVAPIMFGAGHERGIRPGTENVVGIAGLGKACEVAGRDMSFRYEHALKLRDRLFLLLKSNLDVRLNGHEILRLPNTLNVSIKGIISGNLVDQLKDKIAFSSGSACHSGVSKPSPVLKAMGLSDDIAISSVRLSVGKDNTVSQIEEASKIIASHAVKKT